MLAAAFDRHNRVPRAEYFPALCPALGGALAQAGFVTEAVLTLMGAGRDDLRPPDTPSGFTVRPPATAYELDAAARVPRAAFGEAVPAGTDEAALLQRVLANGGAVRGGVRSGLRPRRRRGVLLGPGAASPRSPGSASKRPGVATVSPPRSPGRWRAPRSRPAPSSSF